MKVEVLYFDGCPTYETATKVLQSVLAEERVAAEVELVASTAMKRLSYYVFPGAPPYGWMDETCSPRLSMKTGDWVAGYTRLPKVCGVRPQPRCSRRHCPDWFASGLPRQGKLALSPTIGDVARRDVPTCAPVEKFGAVRERVWKAGWDRCVVINKERIVLVGRRLF
jgi:hypothetical protein